MSLARWSGTLAAASLLVLGAVPVRAQGPPDAAALLTAQRDAMKPLAFMDGVWRGPAWTILPNGTKHEITQTERIGPMLDGSIKVLEGRGYDSEGKVTFNAFGIVSYDAGKQSHALHSHAKGMVGDFALKPTDNGYVWEIPAGPMTIRYSAVIQAGKWREIGERVLPGKPPVQFFEMNLVRVSDSDWPAAGAVPAR